MLRLSDCHVLFFLPPLICFASPFFLFLFSTFSPSYLHHLSALPLLRFPFPLYLLLHLSSPFLLLLHLSSFLTPPSPPPLLPLHLLLPPISSPPSLLRPLSSLTPPKYSSNLITSLPPHHLRLHILVSIFVFSLLFVFLLSFFLF